MIRSESNRFGKPLFILYPGDYYATIENCLLATVTGTCVVVCLYDSLRGMGGMGHFIVPGAMGTEGIIIDEVAKQGITSMEHLVGELVKLGSSRDKLRATLFGAGCFGVAQEALSGGNIRFLHEYFRYEKITVNREDLGGQFRRKIMFNPRSGASFRKHLKNNIEHSEFRKLEGEYIARAFGAAENYGKVLLFD
jgi:chemotaxis protein CheD